MTTAVTGCLVPEQSAWRIPPYAQDMLWVEWGRQTVQASGPRGEFTLPQPVTGPDVLLVTWGAVGGPALLAWSSPVEAGQLVAGWQGAISVGGFVERLHVFEAHGLELVVIELQGEPLPPGYQRLPTLAQMRRASFNRQNDPAWFEERRFTYTLVTLADSIYAEYLHHAMVSELAVDCFATLGPQEGRWHEIVGLPLLVEAVSLLAPGEHGRFNLSPAM